MSTNQKVIILRGINGAGKTHYLENTLLPQHAGEVVHVVEFSTYFVEKAKEKGLLDKDGAMTGPLDITGADMGRAHGRMLREYTETLTRKEDKPNVIIVDAAMLTKLELAPFGALALAYHYGLGVININRPVEECFEAGKESHGKSLEDLRKQLALQSREDQHWPERFPKTVVNNSSVPLTPKTGGKVIRAGINT